MSLANQNKIFYHKPKFKHHSRFKYSSKQYSNPFFDRRRPKRKGREFSLIKLVIFGIAALLSAFIWFLFFSNFFRVKSIEINYKGNIQKQDLEQMVNGQMDSNKLIFFPQKNIFLFSATKLRYDLKNKYNFETIQIQKDYSNKIKLLIEDKQPTSLLLEDGKYYLVDNEGQTITEINLETVKNYAVPVIENVSSKKMQEKKVQVDQSILIFVNNFYNEFIKQENVFKMKNFVVNDDLYKVKLVLENNPSIYVSTKLAIGSQIEKLLSVKDELKSDFAKKEYIDLSIDDRVYYK